MNLEGSIFSLLSFVFSRPKLPIIFLKYPELQQYSLQVISRVVVGVKFYQREWFLFLIGIESSLYFEEVRSKTTKRNSFRDFRLIKDFYSYLVWIFAVLCRSKSHAVSEFNEIIWCIIIICECNYQLWLILLIPRSCIGCYYSPLSGYLCHSYFMNFDHTSTERRRKANQKFRMRHFMIDFMWSFMSAWEETSHRNSYHLEKSI